MSENVDIWLSFCFSVCRRSKLEFFFFFTIITRFFVIK